MSGATHSSFNGAELWFWNLHVYTRFLTMKGCVGLKWQFRRLCKSTLVTTCLPISVGPWTGLSHVAAWMLNTFGLNPPYKEHCSESLGEVQKWLPLFLRTRGSRTLWAKTPRGPSGVSGTPSLLLYVYAFASSARTALGCISGSEAAVWKAWPFLRILYTLASVKILPTVHI